MGAHREGWETQQCRWTSAAVWADRSGGVQLARGLAPFKSGIDAQAELPVGAAHGLRW